MVVCVVRSFGCESVSYRGWPSQQASQQGAIGYGVIPGAEKNGSPDGWRSASSRYVVAGRGGFRLCRRRGSGRRDQSSNQEIKQVFLSQRNKGERSSPQSRQVVALRAKFSQNSCAKRQNPGFSVHLVVLTSSSVRKTFSYTNRPNH